MSDMTRLKMETKDMVADNVQKIAALFPNCVTEKETVDGKLEKGINWKMLKQMLKGKVIDGEEAYEFTWVGKKAAVVEANKPIRKTLRPCKEESKVSGKPSGVSHIRKEPDQHRSGSNFICSSSGFRHSKAGSFPAIQDVF